MRKIILFCASLFVMVPMFAASPAWAQSVLWVDPSGDDGNACSQTSPCATFQGAINKGSVSQINCLGSGNYGPVNITASLTIDCGTGNTGMIVSSSDAITITSASAITVVLRHLSLNGLGSAFNGIATSPAPFSGQVIVEDCTIENYAGAGIGFNSTSGRGFLQVSNSQIINNAGGITFGPAYGQIASLILNRVEVTGNTNEGLALEGGVIVGTVRHSVFAGNGGTGILSQATQVFLTVESTSIVDNLVFGICSMSQEATINVAASTIGGNFWGIHAYSGSIISSGNNQVSTNTVNGTFTSTTPLQ